MSQLQFNIHKKFYLLTKDWGHCQSTEIVMLLDSVITALFNHLELDQITEKTVYVINSKNRVPPTFYPEIVKYEKFNLIYLSTSDRLWSQYSYQFSHELCHHVIDCNFFTTNDKFGWFEEALCELASVFCIDEMSKIWIDNPPYPHWRNYIPSLVKYVSHITGKPENEITIPFKNWLTEHIDMLFKDRYKRVENRIIALQLLPMFKQDPFYWKTVQYLKFIKVTDDMTFDNFLEAWYESVPTKLKKLIINIKAKLNDGKLPISSS